MLLDDVRYHQLNREIERQNDEYPGILSGDGINPTDPGPTGNEQAALPVHDKPALPMAVRRRSRRGKVRQQPKMNLRFFKRVEFAVNPTAIANEWDRHTRHVRNNLANYNFLLDAVGVLLNETMSQVSVEQAVGEPDDADGRVGAAIERLTFDQKQSIAGRSKVCLALLQGLVNAYEIVTRRTPQMANQHVDAVMANGGAKQTIQNLPQHCVSRGGAVVGSLHDRRRCFSARTLSHNMTCSWASQCFLGP